MNDGFYRAFEDRFRGSRELVSSRLQVYLPFVLPLIDGLEAARATDLGCGRGEWLELLGEHGFDAEGVDLDYGMLADCRARGLTVSTADALSHLAALPPDSRDVISAFHLVEHLPFDAVRELIRESLRVLTPGGLLIVETPNPENLVVGTSGFYMDPTHRQPLPPQLLAFLPEHYGFQKIKILRLRHGEGHALRLIDVLAGVSSDYAVVALKKGSEAREASLRNVFAMGMGRTLDGMAAAYQRRLDRQLRARTAATARSDGRLMTVTASLEQRVQLLEVGLQKQAEAMRESQAQLVRIYGSRSWRWTAPLRWGQWQFHLLRRDGASSRALALARKVRRACIGFAISFVGRRPALRRKIVELSQRLGLYERLRRIYFSIAVAAPSAHPAGGTDELPPVTLATASSRVTAVYRALQHAVERRSGENP